MPRYIGLVETFGLLGGRIVVITSILIKKTCTAKSYSFYHAGLARLKSQFWAFCEAYLLSVVWRERFECLT